jgi:hypothetical protein
MTGQTQRRRWLNSLLKGQNARRVNLKLRFPGQCVSHVVTNFTCRPIDTPLRLGAPGAGCQRATGGISGNHTIIRAALPDAIGLVEWRSAGRRTSVAEFAQGVGAGFVGLTGGRSESLAAPRI